MLRAGERDGCFDRRMSHRRVGLPRPRPATPAQRRDNGIGHSQYVPQLIANCFEYDWNLILSRGNVTDC